MNSLVASLLDMMTLTATDAAGAAFFCAEGRGLALYDRLRRPLPPISTRLPALGGVAATTRADLEGRGGPAADRPSLGRSPASERLGDEVGVLLPRA